MKKVVIIGAGFSGISAAYYLNREGFSVELFERKSKPGGLVGTVNTPWGACELAANGILNSKSLEDLASDIGLDLVGVQDVSKRRYIFRSKARRWPLNIYETLVFAFKVIFSRKRPRPEESVLEWGKRVVGLPATKYILAPVLQGIYAGDISKLSASLILNRLFNLSKKAGPRKRGLVSPKGGMIEFFNKIEEYLKSKGVKFHYNVTGTLGAAKDHPDTIYIVATSSYEAGEILKPRNLALAKEIQSIETLSLVKVTAFFKNTVPKLKGFGVLFPRDQNVKALGILFNDFIFDRGVPQPFLSESFIYGGSGAEDVVDLDALEILRDVIEDRKRLLGEQTKIDLEGSHIQRWPSTLPHYTIQLEKKLQKIAPALTQLEKDGVFILGNFLGGIGLSQLLERAAEVPERIRKLHG